MRDGAAGKVTIEEFERLAKDGSGFLDIYNFVTEEIGHGRARMRLPRPSAVDTAVGSCRLCVGC